MKKMITLCLLLSCFCIAGNAQMSLPPKPIMPVSTGCQQVNCIQTNNSLELSFNLSLGEITIVVWGKKKVYSKTEYVFSETKLTIPTSGWSNGNHAICITNSLGKVIATFNVQVQN